MIYKNKNKLKLNNKGVSYILMYTALFVFCIVALCIGLNKFKLSTERATLFQAVDSAARKVATEVYTNSYSTLEQNGTFSNNRSKNIKVAQEFINSLGIGNQVKVTDVQFVPKQAKTIVTCDYNYNTKPLYFNKNGLGFNNYNKKMKITGIAYLKSVEYKNIY